MDNREMVFNLRRRIFEEWRYKRYTWQEIREKYGFSKKWFYKWLGRFLMHGEEGLRDKEKKYYSPHPQALSHHEKERILNYVYNNPTHGPDRIAREIYLSISGKSIWKFLKNQNLNTRRKRRLWAEYQGKPTLTKKEKCVLLAKNRHIESYEPGELVSVDTFTVSVKDLGRVWQFTACDTYSSYGWAKVYPYKTSENAIDFFTDILKASPSGKIRRVLTDQGSEFYNARFRESESSFTRALRVHSVRHTVTKVAHPWTNGYAERLNQTIWNEFYLCRLDKPFICLEELNDELYSFMRYYNFNRRHTGYKLVGGGYQFPGHAFFDVRERENIIEIKY